MNSNLKELPTPDLVEQLLVGIHEPPFRRLRDRIGTLPEPLRVLMLVGDFDTEVQMNGIAGFLENSSGAHLSPTIEAFEAIKATATAKLLRLIEMTMLKHGITHSMLRASLNGATEFHIVSSADIHSKKVLAMLEEVETLASGLYLYRPEQPEVIFELLNHFIDSRRTALLEALESVY
jgi:hypothetical protein